MAEPADPKATNVNAEETEHQPELDEQQEQEQEQQQETQEEESTEEGDESQEHPASRREQLRIQQLLAKLKEDQEGQQPSPAPSRQRRDEPIDKEQPQGVPQDLEAFGREMYQRGLEQAQSIQFHTRLEIDAPRIESKYPQLDKDSDQFNPVLADALNKGYLTMVGYNPKTDTVKNADIRYSDYIEAQFELAGEIASNRVAEEGKAARRQAAQTGLRPDGSEPSKRLNLNKPASQMTDDELRAKIKQLNPNAQLEPPSRI